MIVWDMADGPLILNLDESTDRRLQEAARDAGISREAYAAKAIASTLPVGLQTQRFDVEEATRRLEDYDRTGDYLDGEAVLDAFVAEVEARAACRA